MGSPRSFFRPDHLPEQAWIKWAHTSVSKQCLKKEHNRRQRAFDRLNARLYEPGEGE